MSKSGEHNEPIRVGNFLLLTQMPDFDLLLVRIDSIVLVEHNRGDTRLTLQVGEAVTHVDVDHRLTDFIEILG